MGAGKAAPSEHPKASGGRGETTKGRAPARAPPRRASPAAHPCLPPHPQSLHLCLPRHLRPQSLQHRSPRCQSPKGRSLRRQHPSPRPRYWEVPPAPAAKTRVQGTVRPVGPPRKSSTSSVPAENLFTEPRRRGILRSSDSLSCIDRLLKTAMMASEAHHAASEGTTCCG